MTPHEEEQLALAALRHGITVGWHETGYAPDVQNDIPLFRRLAQAMKGRPDYLTPISALEAAAVALGLVPDPAQTPGHVAVPLDVAEAAIPGILIGCNNAEVEHKTAMLTLYQALANALRAKPSQDRPSAQTTGHVAVPADAVQRWMQAVREASEVDSVSKKLADMLEAAKSDLLGEVYMAWQGIPQDKTPVVEVAVNLLKSSANGGGYLAGITSAIARRVATTAKWGKTPDEALASLQEAVKGEG